MFSRIEHLLWLGFIALSLVVPAAAQVLWLAVPSSVAAVDLNFAAGTYTGGCSLTICVNENRAGTGATDLLPSAAAGSSFNTFSANQARVTSGLGILVEETRTNQLLNSNAPATQTTGTLANGTYTLWVNGAGSATMSAGTATGCGTATASNGAPITFTTSGATGTCTVTVAGSLNVFQLELGAFGTSFIITAGTTVARAADLPSLIGPAGNQFSNPVRTGSYIIEAGGTASLSGSTAFLFGTNSGSRGTLVGSTGVCASSWTATAGSVGTTAVTRSAPVKAALGWDSTGRSIACNGATVFSDALVPNNVTQFIGMSSTGTGSYDGYISHIRLYKARLSNGNLKAF